MSFSPEIKDTYWSVDHETPMSLQSFMIPVEPDHMTDHVTELLDNQVIQDAGYPDLFLVACSLPCAKEILIQVQEKATCHQLFFFFNFAGALHLMKCTVIYISLGVLIEDPLVQS